MTDEQSYPHRVGRLECLIELFLAGRISHECLSESFERYQADQAEVTSP